MHPRGLAFSWEMVYVVSVVRVRMQDVFGMAEQSVRVYQIKVKTDVDTDPNKLNASV